MQEVGLFKIPLLDKKFQIQISEIVVKAHAKLEESKALYAEAENLLLDELGLRDWSPSDDSISVKSFAESFAETGRLDAEYYQPKYDYALERLKNLTPKPLDIVPLEALIKELTNGQTPLLHDLSEGEIPFLTAEHIFDFHINYASAKRVLREHHDLQLQRTKLKQNDIVIAIKGKVGNAAVVDNQPHEANINQDAGLFRLKDGINPYYIVGFLNSVVGKAFVEQISTGQINPFLGLGNLKTLKIPIFEEKQ